MNTIKEFQEQYNVKLICKSESKLMRFTDKFLSLFGTKDFMSKFWTTYRLPFGKAVITYPVNETNPLECKSILEHELIHVKQMETWRGLLLTALFVSLFPLPIFFSGRWFIERNAYLYNIIHHNYEIEWVVNTLWNGYGWCWPRPLMKKWFIKQKAKYNA